AARTGSASAAFRSHLRRSALWQSDGREGARLARFGGLACASIYRGARGVLVGRNRSADGAVPDRPPRLWRYPGGVLSSTTPECGHLARIRVRQRGTRASSLGSPSSEQPFDIGKLELDVSRAAMIAVAGIGRPFHLAQECVHFFGLEPAA